MTEEQRIPFGSRILKNENEIFQHNAWDHCEMSLEMLNDSLSKIKQQQDAKCENPDEFDDHPHQFWDKFYSEKGATFFKDRNWLRIEFPELFNVKTSNDADKLDNNEHDSAPFTLCEVGCGAGNTVFPFLESAKTLGRLNVFAYAFDYSSSAIEVVKSSPLYDETKIKALVYDLTSPTPPPGIPEGGVDICTCIFVFSAINPRDWKRAATNLFKLLKPGGILLFRDYGRYDLAQIRMKKGRLLQDNFYRRGDGTRVYFFTLEELQDIFKDFEILQNESDKRLIVNRKEQLKMFRCWQQGKFRKPLKIEILNVKKESRIDWEQFQETPSELNSHRVEKYQSAEYQELIKEQLSRNALFLGPEGLAKVRGAFVIVVGLGGVGSHAAHMLARAGIEKIRLIDFDQVTLSSLNRHAVATRSDVGIPKVSAMKKRLLEIVPHAEIQDVVQLFSIEVADKLLEGNPDFVLDCIDNLETKIQLIAYCKKNNMKIIASMGAGAKADPSRIQICDISQTIEDPLAKQTRISLRKMGVTDVPCVYSTEKPGKVGLMSLDEEKVEEADQYAPLPSFRSRILPVLGTIPALFGNAMASYVLTDLAGFPVDPIPTKLSFKQNERFWKDIQVREIQILREEAKLKGILHDQLQFNPEMFVNIDDCGFIMEETWFCRSIFGGCMNDRLALVRWDPQLPAKIGNLVCLTKSESKKHFTFTSIEQVCANYPPDIISYVEKRFKRESEMLAMKINW